MGFRLFSSNRGIICVSLIENEIIKSIPETIRRAYRLAKAVRISGLLRPIFPQLIALGMTDDIHNTIRSYMLKTCIFYLTHNASNIRHLCSDRICWTIAIYELLRRCLIAGGFNEYFGNEANDIELFKCENKLGDNYAHRYLCCRQRKGRLLIVARILDVLREYRTHIHELNAKGCEPQDDRFQCSDSEAYSSCADMDYASLRPAPFLLYGYTDEKIKRNDTPDINREYGFFKHYYNTQFH